MGHRPTRPLAALRVAGGRRVIGLGVISLGRPETVCGGLAVSGPSVGWDRWAAGRECELARVAWPLPCAQPASSFFVCAFLLDETADGLRA